MDFSTLKAIAIPQGDVVKIECGGSVIWELPSSYKNWVNYAIDTDKSLYEGKGYIIGQRLSSSGAIKSASKCMTTGYIEVSPNAILRMGGIKWIDSNQSSTNYVCCYDSNFNFVCALNCNGYYGGGTVSGDSNIAVVTLPSTNTIAYARVSVYDSTQTYTQFIVTVNEEIV